ncbi:MBL fold metallo-hydrolase [Porphyromonas sp. COT-290 OH3588]|uniref:MBL fold metallo-hydrolase n=1 Tax=Porphyromonas sp. COT-290 OH3588 TaxID=1515617 RepID=UPI00052CF394|nr:MBL fold metallo-hydrolase [Porphyromonas sp. COT-290 OH3588]KGO01167.1 metallo-beta-lactamase [Porphyromonas sp. COT-290 OH3588]
MLIRFMSLASGSSGNCYYLGHEEGGLLIDAGIAPRSISKALKAEGISLDDGHIRGVLVTHDHADHIRSVGVLGTVYHIPIYASVPVHNRIASNRYIDEDLGASRRTIELGQHFELAGFEVSSFLVPHDSAQNFGYCIRRGDFSFALITDIGHITPEIKRFASEVKHLVIEANYDDEMLKRGPYPEFLKERVAGPLGHLCNAQTAEVLSEIFHPELENIWLCHLSKDNNHPDLCWKTVENRLFAEGIRVGKDVNLIALKRTTPSPMYILEP